MLRTRIELEKVENETLAPYAVRAADATRAHPDTPDPLRTAFQRDRARIIHSKSFRRLKGKTQVFVAHYGDHYRNRLTHTLEVAQLSRDLARSLGCNEDLAECIALAHDLGHTPFGHAGERRLSELLQPFGSHFEHNQQSRRILTTLEKKYPDCDGLNLTAAVLDGLAKHRTIYDQPDAAFATQPSLEAQLVNLADEIAYTNHDLDDGLRAGILTFEQLAEQPLWAAAAATVDPRLPREAFAHRAVSALIHHMTSDLLTQTSANLKTHHIQTAAEITHFAAPLAQFSPAVTGQLAQLRKFLFQNFYLTEEVAERSRAGTVVIEKLFAKMLAHPDRLPAEFAARLSIDPLHTVVADFIAGMTDNFALEFLNESSI